MNQYHDEKGKPRQNIVLGVFDEEVHKVFQKFWVIKIKISIQAWALEHPEKAVERKVDGTVVQVSNMYTQGEICPENGAHRLFYC